MLLIIDSNYICWVAGTALSQGLSYRGGRTEVIYGFLRRLILLCEKFSPSQIAFCWDSDYNLRKEIYADYKGNRHKSDATPEEIASRDTMYGQFREIRDLVLPQLGFQNIFCVRGYESDDLIARIVQTTKVSPAIVITGDSDLYQLLDHCTIYNFKDGGQTMTKDIFTRLHGIPPEKWAEVKAIGGCNTDNVKGISGVGEKKAIDFLTGKLTKGKVFDKITQDEIDKNLVLVKLPFRNTPNPRLKLDDRLETKRFIEVCRHYGLNSLLDQKTTERWSKVIGGFSK